MKAYVQFLAATFAELAGLEDAVALQTWHRVGLTGEPVPDGPPAAELGARLSLLLRSDETRRAITQALEAYPTLEPATAREVLYWHARWWRVSRLPAALVMKLSTVCAQGSSLWREHAVTGNFKAILPAFREIVRLNQEKAELWKTGGLLYDSLLDVHDPGQSAAALVARYEYLDHTPVLGRAHPADRADRPWPKLTLQMAREIASLTGLDLQRARFDEGGHSMTLTTGSNEIRVLLGQGTVPARWRQLLHEIGHARLELTLKQAHRWSWAAQAPSQAFHEGIAAFFESLHSIFLSLFRGVAVGEALDEWRASLSATGHDKLAVEAHPVRLESSGPCLRWHIWVRFKLEKALIENTLDARDLPDAWEFEMRRNFPFPVALPASGCLQDLQWYAGLLGYFPLYWSAAERACALRKKFFRGSDSCRSLPELHAFLDELVAGELEEERLRVASIYECRLPRGAGEPSGIKFSA